MLNLFLNPLHEDEIAEAARYYLPDYISYKKEEVQVPFNHNGIVKIVEYRWVADQWVFIKLK